MARGSLEFRGTADLIGALKRKSTLNEVKNVVRTNAAQMHGGAVQRAPVDTTHLKKSVKLHSLDNGFTAKVASEAEYAGYQEWGTRFQSGTPHVGPSFHFQKIKYLNDMKRLMK